MEALLAIERKKYHKALLEKGVLTIDKDGVPSNADKSSKLSITIANGIAQALMAETAEKTCRFEGGTPQNGMPKRRMC